MPNRFGSSQPKTLRLLHASSPTLLDPFFSTYLTAIKSRKDLVLPPSLPSDIDDERKVQQALKETASRALEVVEVQTAGTDGVGAAGKVYAVIEALPADLVWLEGTKRVLDALRQGR